MMTIKKIFLITTAISISLFFCRCSKELDSIKPKDQIAEDQLSENDIKSLRNGMYAQMENVLFTFAFDFDTRAGHYIGGPGFSLSADPVNMGSADADITTMWQTSFTALSKINYLLDIIAKNPAPAKFDTIKGEALYFRALLYYHLVIRWSGVPILTTRTNAPVQRAKEEEVWNQIKKDLLAAEPLLPSFADRFYISSQASQALLAKVYLSTNDNVNAIAYANKVLNYATASGKFNLTTTSLEYSGMFVAGSTSKELIFALANNTPASPHLYYQQLNDIDGSWSFSPSLEAFNTLFNDKAFAAADKRKAAVFTADRTRMIKFPNGVNGQQLAATTNSNYTPIVVSRFAELYLIKAEAQGIGMPAEQTLAPYFAARYQTVPASGVIASLSDPDFKNLILDENRREFFAEGHRWYDIKRAKRLDLLPNLKGRDYLLNYPVPQTEKDLAGYTQNPGYN